MPEIHETEWKIPSIYDVIIVGAGPCALAVAARLRENTPSALFTDEEHQRYHWINRHAAQAAIKNSKTGQVRPSHSESRKRDSPSLLVLDESGDKWMAKWNRLFSDLEISHLRSPMFFHPDPQDRDGLLAYAHACRRECDCIEIAGCVGKEISKHQMKRKRKKQHGCAKPPVTIDERDRKDYFAPPSDLFRDYCDWISQRYSLCGPGLIRRETVLNIDFDFVPQLSPDEKIFTIRTNQQMLFAKTVILAVGAGNKPLVPAPFPQDHCPHTSHAFQGMDESMRSRLKAAKTTNVLVIGGGLTSAQISDRSIRQGASRVWHIMRGPMKVKPFDVDLSWMGKFRNHEKASFWSADTDEERSDLIKSARGGGSITPRFAKILQKHIACGRMSMHTDTQIVGQNYDPEQQTWSIETEPPLPELPAFHHIYFATGIQSDVKRLEYLQTMRQKYSIESLDGLPALTDDLMWQDNVPLFMTGKLAALRLGPGAGNLEGARVGAERIAWAIGDFLGKEGLPGENGSKRKDSGVETDTDQYRYQVGLGSRFESLAMDA